MGSWCWGITRTSDHAPAAGRFIEYLMEPDQILAMTEANGAIPATRTAIERSPLYAEDGPLRLFVTQLREVAVPRPRTPAYPVITSAFQEAMLSIMEGGDVQAALDEAARVIDRDIEQNEGYPAG
jgi:multiple sugar transport system substrate-binding protein